MARRRMIDPNIWLSEDVSKLTIFERLMLIGMFSNADDEGRGRATPALLRSLIFPYDDIPVGDIEESLDNISQVINIVFYEFEDSRYYEFTKWSKWQRVDKPQESIIPSYIYTQEQNDSKNDSKNDSENDSRLKEEKRSKEKGREEKGSKGTPNSKTIPDKHKFGEYKHVLLSDDELSKLKTKYQDWEERIVKLDEGIELKGYKYTNHYLAIIKWSRNEKGEQHDTRGNKTEIEEPLLGTVIRYDE